MPDRRPGGGRDQAGALGAGERVAQLPGSLPRVSRPTAVTSRGGRGRGRRPACRRRRARRRAPRCPSTSASIPIRSSRLERPAAVERPERRPGQVDADRPRPADDVGARRRPGPRPGAGAAGPARPTAPRPAAAGRRGRRRAGTRPRRARARRARRRGARARAASAGVHGPGVERASAAAGGGGRARRGTRRRGRPRARWRSACGRSARTAPGPQHVAERRDQAAGPEALAGRLAQLGLEADRPAQGLELAGDEPLVDDVGDVDEAHVAPEHQQRQLVAAARLDEHVGRGVGGLEADPGGARPGHGRDQRLDLGR